MEPPATRPWYKKKRYIIPAAIVGGFFALASIAPDAAVSPRQEAIVSPASQAQVDTKKPLNVSTEVAVPKVETAKTYPKTQTQSTPTVPSTLSNDNHYTNTAGNEVHSPAYSSNGCEAAGASAQCGDGTCSFSQSRRGTCSHHGGVAAWF